MKHRIHLLQGRIQLGSVLQREGAAVETAAFSLRL